MKKRKNTAYVLIGIGMFFSIPAGMLIFFEGSIHPYIAVGCHLIGVSVFSVGIYILTSSQKKKKYRDNLWLGFCGIISLILPFYGIWISFSIYYSQKKLKKKVPFIEDDEITVQDAAVFSSISTRSKQLELLDRLDIEPLIDIFRMNQSRLKKSAIELLEDVGTARAVSILKTALMDEDIEIRLFAAGVLGRMDDEYAKGIQDRKELYAEDKRNRKAAKELIDLYVRYCESGLVESAAKKYYYDEVIEIINNLPENNENLYLKSTVEQKLNEMDMAEKLILKALDADNENPKYQQQLWNVLFDLNKFEEIRENINKIKTQNKEKFDKEIIGYWS